MVCVWSHCDAYAQPRWCNATSHARADTLVQCHEALHMRAKLQHAGYVQQHIKWDLTQTDSDETNEVEEDLIM